MDRERAMGEWVWLDLEAGGGVSGRIVGFVDEPCLILERADGSRVTYVESAIARRAWGVIGPHPEEKMA